jgi:phosphatidylethanolamine/phosphatidyl-N-methylethanolamine N-methyltransferase
MPVEPPVYDRLAAHYDRALRPLERLGLRGLRASLLKEIPADSLLLEIGAGTGANFSLYPAGATGVACDPSRGMLARAATKDARPAGVRLTQCRAEQLPFADATFDAAFATLVFCSVESPAAAFAELRRVVRRGGRLLLLEHVRPAGPLGPLFDALSRLTVPLCGDYFNRRTAEEARRAGLRVERVESRLCGVVQLIFCRVG